MNKTLLIFDIDGTLLLSGGCGKTALEDAFEEMFGIPSCWGDTVPDGKTDPAIIDAICQKTLNRSLNSEESTRLCERYHHYFRARIKDSKSYRLMPGVPELLEFLSQRKEFLLALGTGNFEEAGWMKLERGNIHHHFKCGGFASDASKRPDILKTAIRRSEKLAGQPFSKENIYVIGDTLHDVRAARQLDLKSIVVTTGNTPKEDFREAPPDYLLKDLRDRAAFLACLSGMSQRIPF
ncbi:MAG TPA: HAD family hydrolase [Candidatus Omnitrophota bacterium]|nr:HAD family hydrolase [Candidatus Omnitrophota bacterium]